MIKLNKALEYIYYLLAAVFLAYGAFFFFTILEQYHRNFITAIYGLLVTTLIFYIGFLHKKSSTSINFPISSLITILLAILLVFSYFASTDTDGWWLMMVLWLIVPAGLLTFIVGTISARGEFRQATLVSVSLIVLAVIWTTVFTRF